MMETDAGRTRASGGHRHPPVSGHRGCHMAAPPGGARPLLRAALASQSGLSRRGCSCRVCRGGAVRACEPRVIPSEPASARADARRSTQLLERDADLAALRALVDAARDGNGRLAVIEGSAGIGKTRLLAETRAI